MSYRELLSFLLKKHQGYKKKAGQTAVLFMSRSFSLITDLSLKDRKDFFQ